MSILVEMDGKNKKLKVNGSIDFNSLGGGQNKPY